LRDRDRAPRSDQQYPNRALEITTRELENIPCSVGRTHFDPQLDDFVSWQNDLVAEVRLSGSTRPGLQARDVSPTPHLEDDAKVSGAADVCR